MTHDTLFAGKMKMHTGINTGEVLYDRSSSRFHQGPLGKPINIASRLSDLAAPDEILIGESLSSHAMKYFQLEWMGKKILKGFRYPLHVHKIVAERKSSLPNCLFGNGSSLVGRGRELSLLMNGLDEIRRNRAGCVACITGEAGVGKSRLIHEFRASLEGIPFISSQCAEYAKVTPYFPITEIVRKVFRINQSGTDPKILQHKMRRLRISPENWEALSFLCGCLFSNWQRKPDKHKTHICDAVTSLITAATRKDPVIFCIEDVHWADQSTLDLLKYLGNAWDSISSAMLLLTGRNGNQDLPGIHIRLEDLTKEQLTEMTQNMLQTRELPDSSLDFLYLSTGGNPLYLEETIKFFLDKGLDIGIPSKGMIWNDLPSTLHGLIGSRIDVLSAQAKTIIQEAALIGRSFSPELLDAVSTIPRASSFLEELSDHGFVNRSSEHEYVFKHDLTREVAPRALLKPDRIVIHRRIAHELEKDPVSGREMPGEVAFHFEEAREYEKAIEYRMKAAEFYKDTGAWVEAVSHYQTAQRLVPMLHDLHDISRDIWEGIWMCSRVFNPQFAIEALESLASASRESHRKADEAYACIRLISLYSQRGLFEKALQLFHHSLQLCVDDQVLTAAARTAVAHTFTFLGKPILALQLLDQARPVLLSSDTFLLVVNYLTSLAACVWKGNMHESRCWYEKAKQLSNEYQDLDLMAEMWLFHILCLEGNFEEAKSVYGRTVVYEKKLGTLAGGFSYLRIQGSIYFRTLYFGDLKTANADLASFSELSAGIQRFRPLDDLYQAWISSEEGHHARAKELIEACLSGLRKGVANRVPYALNILAEAYLMLGGTDKALANVLECIRWNEENGNQDQLIRALRIYSRVQAEQGSFDEACFTMKRAFLLAGTLGLRPQKAWILGEWGYILAKKGSFRKAHACCRRSHSLWKDMGNAYQTLKSMNLMEKLNSEIGEI
jgi:tetratricopeptide (TPR) repeat protein